MRTDPYIQDVSSLGITARCVDNYDPWRCRFHPELTQGESYHVTHIRMTPDFTYIWLEGREGTYNSVSFEFLLDGAEHDIYSDERCWSEMLKRRLNALEEKYEHKTITEHNE